MIPKTMKWLKEFLSHFIFLLGVVFLANLLLIPQFNLLFLEVIKPTIKDDNSVIVLGVDYSSLSEFLEDGKEKTILSRSIANINRSSAKLVAIDLTPLNKIKSQQNNLDFLVNSLNKQVIVNTDFQNSKEPQSQPSQQTLQSNPSEFVSNLIKDISSDLESGIDQNSSDSTIDENNSLASSSSGLILNPPVIPSPDIPNPDSNESPSQNRNASSLNPIKIQSINQNNQNVYTGFSEFLDTEQPYIRTASETKEVEGKCYNQLGYLIYQVIQNQVECQINKNTLFSLDSKEMDEVEKTLESIFFRPSGQIYFSRVSDDFKVYSLSEFAKQSDVEFLDGKTVIIAPIVKDQSIGLCTNCNEFPAFRHLEIVQSYLQNQFYYNLPLIFTIVGMLLIGWSQFYLLKAINNPSVGIIIDILLTSIFSVLGLIIFYIFRYNWPILQLAFLIISNSIYIWFFKYAKIFGEKNFVQNAFGRYISPEQVKILIENPKKLQLGGEEKDIAILFSDIRNFTSLSEKTPPQELVNQINHFLESMGQIIQKNEGTIDKYIGDAVMAFWNAPLGIDNYKTKAIETGLKMHQKMDEIRKSNPAWKNLEIGIGIHSGKVIVGNIGGNNRFDYTVLGDNVNLASRVESLTKKYGLNFLVTGATKSQYNSDQLIFRIVDKVRVKGKYEFVEIYQPLLNTPDNHRFKQIYEYIFDLYQKGNFNLAYQEFKKYKNTNPSSAIIEDKPTKLLFDRMKEYNGGDWTGIWSWDSK